MHGTIWAMGMGEAFSPQQLPEDMNRQSIAVYILLFIAVLSNFILLPKYQDLASQNAQLHQQVADLEKRLRFYNPDVFPLNNDPEYVERLRKQLDTYAKTELELGREVHRLTVKNEDLTKANLRHHRNFKEISKNLDALSCEFSQIEFGGGSCLQLGLPPEKQKGYAEPDAGLLAALEPFLQNMEVADYGAGFGLYGRRWADPGAGIEYTAYDAAQYIEIVTHSAVKKMDLIYEQTLPTVNYILCLNVGQHTPQYYQNQVILNIARHAGSGVILAWGNDDESWNPMEPAEVTAEFARFGFELNPSQTSKFREVAESAFLKENLVVLDRVLEVEPEPDLGGDASEEDNEVALQREEAATT